MILIFEIRKRYICRVFRVCRARLTCGNYDFNSQGALAIALGINENHHDPICEVHRWQLQLPKRSAHLHRLKSGNARHF